MKKIIIGIIATLLVGAGVVTGIVIMNNNKHNYLSEFKIDNYNFKISSKDVKNENKKTYFTTSFEVVKKEDNHTLTSMYFIDFNGITTNKPSDDYKEVTINKKTFKYDLDDAAWGADMYYQIPKTDKYVYIQISGGNVYSDGNQVKTLATVDEELLNSKELAEVFDFDIK